MILPNGVSTDYVYDNINRLTNITHDDAVSRLLASYTYTIGADGRHNSLTEELRQTGAPGTNPITETHTIDYGYDNLNRLTLEDAASGVEGYTAWYTYDLVGNRKTRKIDATGCVEASYNYDVTDRLQNETYTSASCAVILNNRRYYAYANDGRITYRKAHSAVEISGFKAFLFGMPSEWSMYTFIAIMVLLPIAFFIPALVRLLYQFCLRHGIASDKPKQRILRLGLLSRGLCVMLAYVMLIGPWNFQQMAEAATQYTGISADDWGSNGTVITYQYDANGSVIEKDDSSSLSGPVAYDYNLQNRLASTYLNNDTPETNDDTPIADYTYNPEGIRVKKIDDNSGSPITTYHLIDRYNHTGYTQVLEELPSVGGTPVVSYTIGDDVITQSRQVNSYTAEHLLYDGHGSTRQLAAPEDGSNRVEINEYYSYDAYGVMLGGNPTSGSPAATNMLYAGEQFDTHMQMYYNRARYYDQNTGRFNRLDPFAGSNQDPQSLHKYLYTHCNPINSIDPTGEWSITSVVTALSVTTVLLSSFTTGFVTGVIAADMAEDWKPDGVIFNIGLQIGLKGGVGGVTVSLVYDVKLRQSYIMLTGEAGIAPTTYLRGQTGKINPTLTAGVIYNMNSVSQLNGLSVTATWPAVLWRYKSRFSSYKNPFYQICVNLAQLMKRANIVRHNHAVVELTQSLKGPAIFAGGVAPYSFQWNVGYTGGPWSMGEISQRLPAFARRTIQNVKGYLNSLSSSSSLSDFESQLGNALTSVPDPDNF